VLAAVMNRGRKFQNLTASECMLESLSLSLSTFVKKKKNVHIASLNSRMA
jgi:hypothetical protein